MNHLYCRLKECSFCSHRSSGSRILWVVENRWVACLCFPLSRLPPNKSFRRSPQHWDFLPSLGKDIWDDWPSFRCCGEAYRRGRSSMPIWGWQGVVCLITGSLWSAKSYSKGGSLNAHPRCCKGWFLDCEVMAIRLWSRQKNHTCHSGTFIFCTPLQLSSLLSMGLPEIWMHSFDLC